MQFLTFLSHLNYVAYREIIVVVKKFDDEFSAEVCVLWPPEPKIGV